MLAVIWFLLAAYIFIDPMDQMPSREPYLAAAVCLMAVYNLIRWLMQIYLPRGKQAYHDEQAWRRKQPQVTDPVFDFSDPKKSDQNH